MQARLLRAAAALEEMPDDRPEDVRNKAQAFRRHEQTAEYLLKKQLADAWCAAFVIQKAFSEPGRESSARGITQGHLNDLADGRPLPVALAAETARLSGEYQFLHWHLAYPEVIAKGGFDCVLGNPPWERIKLPGRGVLRLTRHDDRQRQERRGAQTNNSCASRPMLLWPRFGTQRHDALRAKARFFVYQVASRLVGSAM